MSSIDSRTIFVDLQGFIIDERFKVKEVAVLKRGKELIHYIFGPSIPWDLLENDDRSRATWLTHNHHGIRWNDGEVEYRRAKDLIERALRSNRDENSSVVVYVKGLQKKGWLEAILPDIQLRIETMDNVYDNIDRLNDLSAEGTFSCGRHTGNCAMENVLKLHKWWSLYACENRENFLSGRIGGGRFVL